MEHSAECYRFYEFFAGGGMANAGLGQRWQCLFANDIDETKAAAYAANWSANHLVVADIKNLAAQNLPGFADLAWASFPCQDLSLAGQGVGLSGARSGTFWTFWDLIRKLTRQARGPRLVVLENVCGAITSHGGSDFSTICEALHTGRYKFGAMVVDAKLFLPQSRPRLFIVAVRDDLYIPDSVRASSPSPLWHTKSLRAAISRLAPMLRDNHLWFNMPCPKPSPRRLADLVEDEPASVAWHSEQETQKLISMMSKANLAKVAAAQETGKTLVGSLYKRTRDGKQRAEVRFDGLAGCLRTPKGGSSRQILLMVEGRRLRSRLLSAREAARLMGLPDSYSLPEKVHAAYHLAGDGVAVPVVGYLARMILEPILRCNAFNNEFLVEQEDGLKHRHNPGTPVHERGQSINPRGELLSCEIAMIDEGLSGSEQDQSTPKRRR